MTFPSGRPPDELTLAAEFDEPTREQWRRLVLGVLTKSGAAPDDESAPELALATTTYDGITVRPLYTADGAEGNVDAVGFPGTQPFVRGGRPEGGVLTGWDIRTRHANPGPKATNDAVLADLSNGATSLWLVVGESGIPADQLDVALDGVLLDLAPVVLDAGADYPAAAERLLALAAVQGVPAGELHGNLGADPLALLARTGTEHDIAEAAALSAKYGKTYPALRTIAVDATAYHDAGGSDSEELGASIASGVTYLRALTDAGLPFERAAAQLEFRYAASADQFLTIAKLRAARRLWARVTEVCGTALPQQQHAVTASAMMTARDPWVNMLRTTVACFAAGVGGAEAVTVRPFDEALGLPDGLARRIARNTSSILLEESKLAGVIDPAGGSWYVERLTADLARAAWGFFTEIEAAGGMAEALGSGMVADRVGGTWQARRENIARRHDPITGVTEFPNLAEQLPQRAPAPHQVGGGLPVVRYAQAFERLRARSDAHLAATGERPKIFLATLGPVATHTARAAFATNAFGAGGIAAENPGAVVDAVAAFQRSGATIACLAGTDSAYAEHAEQLAAALKQVGAHRVLLAGKSAADLSNVDTYLDTGCDVLAIMTDALDALGVS